MADTTFESNGSTITFDQVSEETTFGLRMNQEIIIRVAGEKLSADTHRIDFSCIVPGLGKISFDFSDRPAST
jgi:hypothetical protein